MKHVLEQMEESKSVQAEYGRRMKLCPLIDTLADIELPRKLPKLLRAPSCK